MPAWIGPPTPMILTRNKRVRG
uniref:Uncharacterized protein n=1 Tax=Anguilla anguilla TaxID=7936 RepID=A0A0E9Q764_ANGAN